MRILYVWDADYPWDVRTEKVCAALSQAGHQVVIAARNLEANTPSEQRPEGLVERLPSTPLLSRRISSFPVFFNPLWIAHLARQVRRHRIELVVVRDLPLALTALLVSGPRPVILDMAENYPAMIRDIWTDGRRRPLDVFVRNPAIVALVERMVVGRVDHILTVVEESSQRLEGLGIPPSRMTVVSNTPPLGRVGTVAERSPEDPLQLIYLGLMEEHRGIGSVLRAAAELKRTREPFHLGLVGDGRDLQRFRNYAVELGLTVDDVTFHGRLSNPEALKIVSAAHIGLVPHEARESWNTTIPNKLFDYMAAGLAVITSDAVPAARVVRETGAGLVFRSGDGLHLAEMIRGCSDMTTWRRFRQAGQQAILSQYNWELDTRRLLEAVSTIRGHGAAPGR